MISADTIADSNSDEQTEKASKIVFPDVVFEYVSDLMSDVTNRVSEEVRKVETDHRARLEKILSSVRDSVRKELSQEMRKEFENRFQKSMEIAQQQFKEKLQQLGADADKERQVIEAELQKIRQVGSGVSAELMCKETELGLMDREAEAMADDPDVQISTMIRHNAARNELRAYIKGLRFNTGDSTPK
jgi:hypothetical protein